MAGVAYARAGSVMCAQPQADTSRRRRLALLLGVLAGAVTVLLTQVTSVILAALIAGVLVGVAGRLITLRLRRP
jgi:uncharacterized membrane protein YjjB (DUF3815 family)